MPDLNSSIQDAFRILEMLCGETHQEWSAQQIASSLSLSLAKVRVALHTMHDLDVVQGIRNPTNNRIERWMVGPRIPALAFRYQRAQTRRLDEIREMLLSMNNGEVTQ